MTEKVKLSVYWDMLNQHDWYYQYSDDPGVWRRGQAAQERIRMFADQSPQHRELYDGFVSNTPASRPVDAEESA